MAACTWRSPSFLSAAFSLVCDVSGGSGRFLVTKHGTDKTYELHQYRIAVPEGGGQGLTAG